MLHGHGGDIYSLARELRKAPDTILDFSSNVSPLPPPQGLKELLISRLDEIRCLPEVDSLGLRRALARKFGLSPACFLIGAGTTDWIFALPRILRPDRVLIPLPTYSDYADATRLASCPIGELGPWPHAESEANTEILAAISRSAHDHVLIYLCNPNNPTGRFIPTKELQEAISHTREAIWVVDESYAPFVAPDRESSLISRGLPENLVVLRSFSKIYGIPGLRLGYAVARAELIEALASGARPWAVTRLAQIAGEYLVDQTEYQEEVRSYCRKERRRLLSMLAGLPLLRPVEAVTHFILFQVLSPWTAAYLTESLRKNGVLIRDCTNFVGLEGEYIRISLKSEAENDSLVRLLRELDRDNGPGPI